MGGTTDHPDQPSRSKVAALSPSRRSARNSSQKPGGRSRNEVDALENSTRARLSSCGAYRRKKPSRTHASCAALLTCPRCTCRSAGVSHAPTGSVTNAGSVLCTLSSSSRGSARVCCAVGFALTRKSARRCVNVELICGNEIRAVEPKGFVIESVWSVVFVYPAAAVAAVGVVVPVPTRSSKGLYPRTGVFSSRSLYARRGAWLAGRLRMWEVQERMSVVSSSELIVVDSRSTGPTPPLPVLVLESSS